MVENKFKLKKSYFGYKIENEFKNENEELIISLFNQNNEIYFSLNFLNSIFIPFHGNW